MEPYTRAMCSLRSWLFGNRTPQQHRLFPFLSKIHHPGQPNISFFFLTTQHRSLLEPRQRNGWEAKIAMDKPGWLFDQSLSLSHFLALSLSQPRYTTTLSRGGRRLSAPHLFTRECSTKCNLGGCLFLLHCFTVPWEAFVTFFCFERKPHRTHADLMYT